MAAEFELLVSGAVARASLLERALYSPGPWEIVIYGSDTECRTPAQRRVIDEEYRVSFVAYAPGTCEDIEAVELYSGHSLVTARPVSGSPSAPCRIVFDIGISNLEAVA